MQVKITTKHVSNSPVTFVIHKRFAVLFFLPSCCVNSLITSYRIIDNFDWLRRHYSSLVTLAIKRICLKGRIEQGKVLICKKYSNP